MSKSTGKIIGVIIGMALGRFRSWPLALIGLVIGHLFDMGLFSKNKNSASSENGPPSNRPVGTASPYSILGVSETASMDEVEQAFRRKISDYHPDKVANAAVEIKELAEQRAREINSAFEEIQKNRKF
jgi:DnaJ-domain-containing protein 1